MQLNLRNNNINVKLENSRKCELVIFDFSRNSVINTIGVISCPGPNIILKICFIPKFLKNVKCA